MPLLSNGKKYLFILRDMISEILINRSEIGVKSFKIISVQYGCQFLNIFKVSISVLGKPLLMNRMIPA
jgi:hypothetical protein